MIRRLWESPTFTTWASVAIRAVGAVVVLPILVTRLSSAEVAVWYLFVSVFLLQTLGDWGLAPTFTRVIAFAMSGNTDLRSLEQTPPRQTGQPDWAFIARIWSTMRAVYNRAALIVACVLAVVGTLSVARPITFLSDPTTGWTAWLIVLTTSVITLRGNAFGAYLQGINQVALYRRWEAITTIGAILSTVAVLLLGGRLLALVIANQTWLLLNQLRDWQLCRIVAGGRFRSFKGGETDPAVWATVWPSAWRSGLGVMVSRGISWGSGLVYAQLIEPGPLASYLLGLRAVQLVSDFSQGPFYSKIPVLARLRAAGDFSRQLEVAKRGMRLSHWTFTVLFLIVAVSAAPILSAIGSTVRFASPVLWTVLGLAFFTERFGAMHLQLYSTTNRIIWHTTNGISGAIAIGVAVTSLRFLNVLAFPVGILAGNLGFYSWYPARQVYRLFGERFWSFERSVSLVPWTVIAVYAASMLYR
jgi:hypothetical protein